MKTFTKIITILMSWIIVFSLHAQISDMLNAKLKQKVASLEFKDTNIEDVLRLIARQNKLNIVLSSEVKGRITISLSDVTVKDVLSSTLQSQGYHYLIENDVIIIKSFEKKVFGELKNKVFHLKYLDAVDLMGVLEPILTEKGKMQVLHIVKTEKVELKRSATLLVSDIAENIEHISEVIEQMDLPQKQIIIEVKLIEKILGENEKFGFDWPKSVKVSMTGSDPQSGSIINETNISAFSGFPVNQQSFKLGVLTVNELNFTLDMLSKDENAKLISNPKVTTLNNKTARIRVGSNIPIVEVNRGAAGDIITYKEKQVDVKLEVTPRLEPDNRIYMHVHPSVEEITGYIGPGDYPQPVTSIREVETYVSVAENESIVIGGMVKEKKSSVVQKIWLLGDIPLLGALFQNVVNEEIKTDLLIFITPKISQSEQ